MRVVNAPGCTLVTFIDLVPLKYSRIKWTRYYGADTINRGLLHPMNLPGKSRRVALPESVCTSESIRRTRSSSLSRSRINSSLVETSPVTSRVSLNYTFIISVMSFLRVSVYKFFLVQFFNKILVA